MRRRGPAGLCAAFMASIIMLGGCGSKNVVMNYQETGKETTDITFFGNKYEQENVTVIEEIISGFMKENPDIRVSYESIKGAEYYEALEKRMAAGKGDDVFMVNHDVVLDLREKGQLADLSGMNNISNYTDQMITQMDDNGKIYWVPTTVSVFGLYCNLDLLEEYGQKVPGTLPEWESVCQFFKNQGITPIIANNDISLKTLAIGRSLCPIYQGRQQREVYDSLNQGEAALSEYLTPGFELVDDMIGKGYIDAEKALVTKKTSDDLEEFVKGQAPFMLTGAWAAGRVENMEPDFAFQVVPYPAMDDGQVLVINGDTRLSVNADSRHQDAAVRFVEYFTRAENIQKFADQQSSFSPLKEGSPSSVKAVQPLIPCYQEGNVVIGSDGLLELPIWDLTAEVSRKLLSREPLESVMDWMDQQAAQEGETQ